MTFNCQALGQSFPWMAPVSELEPTGNTDNVPFWQMSSSSQRKQCKKTMVIGNISQIMSEFNCIHKCHNSLPNLPFICFILPSRGLSFFYYPHYGMISWDMDSCSPSTLPRVLTMGLLQVHQPGTWVQITAASSLVSFFLWLLSFTPFRKDLGSWEHLPCSICTGTFLARLLPLLIYTDNSMLGDTADCSIWPWQHSRGIPFSVASSPMMSTSVPG